MADRWSEEYYFEKMAEFASELPGCIPPTEVVAYCKARWEGAPKVEPSVTDHTVEPGFLVFDQDGFYLGCYSWRKHLKQFTYFTVNGAHEYAKNIRDVVGGLRWWKSKLSR